MPDYTINASDAGCWLNGSCNRSADELNSATIDIAVTYGWELSESDRAILEMIQARWPEASSWAAEPDGDDPDSDGQVLYEIASDAIDYLNTLVPEGYAFQFDDGLYLYAIDEDGEQIFD